MKRIKQLKYILLFAIPLVLFSTGGCKKFLERKPLGTGIETDITQGGVEGAVFGLYGALRTTSGMSDWPTIWFKSIRSDDAKKGSTPDDSKPNGDRFDDFKYDKVSDGNVAADYWNGHYSFIGLCNNVIHDIDSLGLADPASLTNMAEAKFLRAWAYFDLVRDFGEVPIIDFKVYETSQANVPKKSVAEVYQLIDQDLNFAEANLPLTWESRFIGRLTQGAAKTLIAKTMLYRQNWSGALAKCEEVIGSNQYALITSGTGSIHPYAWFFTEDGENSSESIFEVQNYVNSNGSQSLGNNYNNVQGVRGSGDWDLGWGFNVPTTSLINAYEAGDPRKAATILESGQPDGIYGQTVPASLAAIQPYWNKKIYTDPARRKATGDRFGYWLNVRLLRYADVLLMAAEAANELGGSDNVTKAHEYLELIRARARNGNNAVLPEVTTTNKDDLRVAIHHERRIEFAMELERFYDLVRWGEAETVLGPLGYQTKNKYYPFLQADIDKSGGVLKQNPDWQ
ncbi:MAG: RagB/SusD family nutrient uptake outer membrane protein [Agriterribacter sp.]